jgi:hypothetical protein
MKGNEIKQLQANLVDRDKVIQTMKEQEATYLAQADNFKVSWKTLCKQGDAKSWALTTGLQLLRELVLQQVHGKIQLQCVTACVP